MMTSKTLLALLFLGVFSPAISLGQTSAKDKPSTTSEPNTVSFSGKVFAITKAGDVKPALMANVYLFAAKSPTTTHVLRLVEIFDEFKNALKETGENGYDDANDRAIEDHCHSLLHQLDEAATDDLKDKWWEPSAQYPDGPFSPSRTTDTDETGAFSIADIKPDDYLVMVRGQAGSNDALWIEKVTLVRGEPNKTFKLSSVAESCRVE